MFLLGESRECRFCGRVVRGPGAAGILVCPPGRKGCASAVPPETEGCVRGAEKSGK